jgi:hypothetical protein
MKLNWKELATTLGVVIVGVLVANQVQTYIDKNK